MSGTSSHRHQSLPAVDGAGIGTPRPEASGVDLAGLPIGRRVALWRSRRGLSQQVLADLIGRSQSWVQKMERGKRPLDRLSVIGAVADALGIDPLLLLRGQPDRATGAAGPPRQEPVADLDLAAAGRDVEILMYHHLKSGPARTVRAHTRSLRGVLTVAYAAMATEGVPLPTRCRVIATVLHRHRGARP